MAKSVKSALSAMIAVAMLASAGAMANESSAPPKVAPSSPAKKPAAKPVPPKSACVSADEAVAFRLRHLQSRLMVAGLSCNQKDAYNSFVTAHKTTLGQYGAHLLAYYKRAGGQAVLNRYITDLANAVASIRSDDPDAFCTHTWGVFWDLQEHPAQLFDLAAANPVPAIGQPAPCAVSVERPAAPQTASSLQK